MKKSISIMLIFLHLTCLPAGRHLSSALADDLSAEASAKVEYRLAPNDQLEIKIVGKPDLATKQTITPDGTLSLWYKVITATAVVVGIYATLNR